MKQPPTNIDLEINSQRCITIIIIFFAIIILQLAYLYNTHYENIAKEAIKAGLVQQSAQNGGIIWVKPEDYKPYPISYWNSPENK